MVDGDIARFQGADGLFDVVQVEVADILVGTGPLVLQIGDVGFEELGDGSGCPLDLGLPCGFL